MIKTSVVIPTRNRAQSLAMTLESLNGQSLFSDTFEVIVVDNGSTDNTDEICSSFQEKIRNFIYVFEEKPGLHNGRHTGAEKANGEIITFADDDIIAFPCWLEAITDSFKDDGVALVGGKNLPKWEGDIPQWVNLFKNVTEYGWTIGYLSLLDFGNEKKEIPGHYVFGCNFSIRKSVLFECNGFHPDAMPQELIQFRGDGETALSLEIERRGYKVAYNPLASVFHRVPKERLSLEYFCQRAFNQGISDSYTEIRSKKGLIPVSGKTVVGSLKIKTHLKKLLSSLPFSKKRSAVGKDDILTKVSRAYLTGKAFHQEKVLKNSELLSYILLEKYY